MEKSRSEKLQAVSIQSNVLHFGIFKHMHQYNSPLPPSNKQFLLKKERVSHPLYVSISQNVAAGTDLWPLFLQNQFFEFHQPAPWPQQALLDTSQILADISWPVFHSSLGSKKDQELSTGFLETLTEISLSCSRFLINILCANLKGQRRPSKMRKECE